MHQFARFVVAAIACSAPLSAPLAAQQVTADQLHSALIGRWTGTLEYKDYSPPYGRVNLPTTFEISARKNGGVLRHATYDDGPGKTVISDDYVLLRADGTTLDWSGTGEKVPSIFRVLVLSRDPSTETIRLVSERQGEDDRKPAMIRESITLTATTFAIVKEVRFDGAAYTFRHEYRMTRAAAAP